MEKTHFIDGQWIKGQGSNFQSTCAASGEAVWHGTNATDSEVSEAVLAAKTAFKTWSTLRVEQRADFLKAYVAAIETQKEDLTLAIAKEAGKPLWEAKTEAQAMIGKLAGSLTAYEKRTPSTLVEKNNLQTRLTHRPHGVVAVLGPYNFPGHLPNGQIIPALLAGNCVVFKPSEHTPLVAEIMLQCFEMAKLPKGVMNLIQGDGHVGQALINQEIEGVYFTGSYQTGRKIHQHFAGRPDIILALEMGGNNPLIIDDVNQVDAAVYHTVMSAFITAGQRCTCARRLMIPDNSYGEKFLSALVARVKDLSVGPYWQRPEPFMGAVISKDVAGHILGVEKSLIANGGQSVIAMQSLGEGLLTPGLIDMTNSKHKDDDELFGPLLKIWRYSSFDEAMELANDTGYGLSAGLISENSTHQSIFYEQVRAGIVNINRQLTGASGALPFGGIGQSGNHRAAAAYAADFCAYPMASLMSEDLQLPENLPIGYGC